MKSSTEWHAPVKTHRFPVASSMPDVPGFTPHQSRCDMRPSGLQHGTDAALRPICDANGEQERGHPDECLRQATLLRARDISRPSVNLFSRIELQSRYIPNTSFTVSRTSEPEYPRRARKASK